jgi:hypothetical protein
MKVNYIAHKNQWSAFMTLNGLCIQEYGKTPKEAREKLADRISKSEFLLAGIKI